MPPLSKTTLFGALRMEALAPGMAAPFGPALQKKNAAAERRKTAAAWKKIEHGRVNLNEVL
jgi:hypothetical protein